MLRPLLLLLVAFLCFVILYAAFIVIRTSLLIGVSTKLVALSKPYQQHVTGGHPRILVLGDSTAVGTGTADNKGSTAGWFGQDFPNAQIINYSVNGLKAGQLDSTFPVYSAQSFDLVLIQIGANDIIQRTPAAAFTASLTSVFQKAKLLSPQVVALHSGNVGAAPLFSVWPLNIYFRAKSLQMRTLYKKIAVENGVTYVDLFTEPADDPFLQDIPKYYAADGLHLTEAGYKNWYQQIRSAMTSAGMKL
jgi:lysophospholipase L1-like esterase